MVESSLIGVCPNAVSIEICERELTPELMAALANSLEAYLADRGDYQQKTVYPIDGLLAKKELTEAQANTLVNFTKSPFGFYPVLVGENSYKQQTDYIGFKAYNAYQSKV